MQYQSGVRLLPVVEAVVIAVATDFVRHKYLKQQPTDFSAGQLLSIVLKVIVASLVIPKPPGFIDLPTVVGEA